MVVMGVSMNWKANDEGSAKGRLSGILQKQVRSRDQGSQCTYMLDSSDGRVDAALSYSFTPFLEQAILRTAQAFQHPTCFRDTPTSYTQSWCSGFSWCLIQAWVALHLVFFHRRQHILSPLSGMNPGIAMVCNKRIFLTSKTP